MNLSEPDRGQDETQYKKMSTNTIKNPKVVRHSLTGYAGEVAIVRGELWYTINDTFDTDFGVDYNAEASPDRRLNDIIETEVAS
jgi:hypothetical protein